MVTEKSSFAASYNSTDRKAAKPFAVTLAGMAEMTGNLTRQELKSVCDANGVTLTQDQNRYLGGAQAQSRAQNATLTI